MTHLSRDLHSPKSLDPPPLAPYPLLGLVAFATAGGLGDDDQPEIPDDSSILPWALAALLGVVAADGANGADDPYRWLEEVLGEKPMAWVKDRNAESTRELTHAGQFQAAAGPHPRDPRFQGADPDDRQGGPVLLQLLARREEPARALAAHHAGRIPQGPARLGGRDRPRRAGPAGARELGLARGRCAPARAQAGARLALARRRRRLRRPRVRHGEEDLHQGRVRPARGQEPRRLARRRQRLRRHRLRAGLADRFGIPAGRQGMEARDAADRGRGRLRGPSPRT